MEKRRINLIIGNFYRYVVTAAVPPLHMGTMLRYRKAVGCAMRAACRALLQVTKIGRDFKCFVLSLKNSLF